jgi:hypothetical protein
MTQRVWVRLDNASNIFLAARSDADPKVFRVGVELDRDVEPRLLQQALDATYDRYPLYHAVLRRGVFWYYLQASDLRPVVTAERLPTCAPIYQADRRNLLFRVVHHRRRISLEVFHALSDGTGALWFLTDLVAAYVTLREGSVRGPTPLTDLTAEGDVTVEPANELTTDGFTQYFRREAAPAALEVENRVGTSLGSSSAHGHPRSAEPRKVHRIRGTRTPDNRTRAVELTMSATEVLALARGVGVSLTMYLTGLFFESVRRSSGGLGRHRTLAASVPVNLRQFFPSTSPRNFFATVRVEHTYGEGADDLDATCRQLEAQFRTKITPEALDDKLRRFIRLERMPLLRVMPRPAKDVILAMVNRRSNRGLSIAVSNLGRVSLPEPADSAVGRMLFHVSAVRPQLCAVSHAGLLVVTFTSPFSETGHIKEYARLLTASGVAVTVGAARVTEAELAEVGG